LSLNISASATSSKAAAFTHKVECLFGWGKQHGTMRKTKHRGMAAVAGDFLINIIAYNPALDKEICRFVRNDLTLPDRREAMPKRGLINGSFSLFVYHARQNVFPEPQ
jgi:hypothetical protein